MHARTAVGLKGVTLYQTCHLVPAPIETETLEVLRVQPERTVDSRPKQFLRSFDDQASFYRELRSYLAAGPVFGTEHDTVAPRKRRCGVPGDTVPASDLVSRPNTFSGRTTSGHDKQTSRYCLHRAWFFCLDGYSLHENLGLALVLALQQLFQEQFRFPSLCYLQAAECLCGSLRLGVFIAKNEDFSE